MQGVSVVQLERWCTFAEGASLRLHVHRREGVFQFMDKCLFERTEKYTFAQRAAYFS